MFRRWQLHVASVFVSIKTSPQWRGFMHTKRKIRSFVTPDLLFCQQIQNSLAHFLQ